MSNQQVVYAADGSVIRRSRNLRGIRSEVSRRPVEFVHIQQVDDVGAAMLSVRFKDGSFFRTGLASFRVLQGFVRRWRNVYGASLIVNGHSADRVSYNNPALV